MVAGILVAQMAFGLLVMTICLPSMQEWGALFGATQSQVQATFGAYLVTYGALQLVYGPLSDRHGRRRVMQVGLGVAIVGLVQAALATRIETLILARALQGAGCAACMVCGRAAVQDLFEGPMRTRVMAYVGMAMGLCPPLATVLGGQVHVHAGWATNFWIMAVMGVLLMVLAQRGLPPLRQAVDARTARHEAASPATATPAAATRGLRAMGRSYARLAREPGFLLNVLLLSMAAAAFYAFLGGAPGVLGHLGVGPDGVGFYVMCVPLSYIVGNFLTTRLAQRQGERWLRRTGLACTLTGISLMMLLGLAGVAHPLAFALPLTLMGMGHGLFVPAALAATVGLVPALAGAAAAVAGVSQQLLGAAGGYAVGWLSLESAAPLGGLMLALTLVAVWTQWRVERLGGATEGR
jgi:DHA1 family bicyclomycin/chloramphenicol resistance-like MFS transporter